LDGEYRLRDPPTGLA